MGVRVHRHRLTPVIGGMTVAVTAAGGIVATTNVAPALAEPASAATPSAAAGAGVLQSCEAYFGFGKGDEGGALNVVEFDVADTNGDDGVDHAVPDDTEVVLVIETEDGTVECTPFEVTESDWDDEFAGAPVDIPFPGPGHYAYPSIAWEQEIGADPSSQVTSVAFRVGDIPTAHTLESPTGDRPLTDHYLSLADDSLDPRVYELIAADPDGGTSAADAFAAARATCAEEDLPEEDETDPDLIAAAQVLSDYLDQGGTITEVDCFDIFLLHSLSSYILAALDTSDYVENIRLSTPEPTSSTTSSTTSTTSTTSTSVPDGPGVSPAAKAVKAKPTFTG